MIRQYIINFKPYALLVMRLLQITINMNRCFWAESINKKGETFLARIELSNTDKCVLILHVLTTVSYFLLTHLLHNITSHPENEIQP